MEVNASDFLTNEQKSKLGTALFDKMLASIKSIKVEPLTKLDLKAALHREMEAIFENGEIYENIDFKKVGKVFQSRIIYGIKADK